MRRAADVVGNNVMNIHSGEVVGRVEDLLFNREGRLQGVLLDKKYWFTKVPYVPLSQILSIGEDLVTITEEPQQSTENISQSWVQLLKGRHKIKGVPVITSKGKQLGILEDVYFREEVGTIIGYELSDGFFADLMEGRRTIESLGHFSLGKDALVIHHEADNSTL